MAVGVRRRAGQRLTNRPKIVVAAAIDNCCEIMAWHRITKAPSPGDQITRPDPIDQRAHGRIGCPEMAACGAVTVEADSWALTGGVEPSRWTEEEPS
jgi:hypothetical protein